MLSSKQLAALLSSKPHCLLQVTAKATICHKSELPPKKVYHWPYKTRSWGLLTSVMDPFTKNKFTENSKIVLVEGSINSGKDDFAKRLADELGMKYAEPIDLVSYYKNDYGYDYRALNPLLPERMRHCDWKMWHENPSRHSAIHMQHVLFKLRLAQYIRAIQHVFNTGQGVVLNRSVFTERVFVEAMHELGWLPMGYLRGDGVRFYDWRLRYNYVREQCLTFIPKPHLTIYLDAPIDKCMERIKSSTDPMEANSKALIPEFLEHMKEAYENIVLPKMEHNGNVLRYKVEDLMTNDELGDVIDDIKELDFEYDTHDTKFSDWDNESEKLWHRRQRMRFTTHNVFEFLEKANTSWYDIAGLGDSITEIDKRLRRVLYESHVSPVGFLTDYDTDIKYQGLIKSVIDWPNFGKEFDQHLKNDVI